MMDMDLHYLFTIAVMVCLTLISYVWFSKSNKIAFKPGAPFTQFELIDKVNVTHNTRRFKIALQTPKTVLGLPIGSHVRLRCLDKKGEEVLRSYTPVTSDDEIGYMELMIKIYPSGKMGQYLDHLNIGDKIEIMMKKGHIHYDSPSHITLDKFQRKGSFDFQIINLIAGGTGLTPMYQILQQIMKDKNDKTKVKMLYANRTADDILCAKELEIMRWHKNVDIVFTLSTPPSGWKEETGHVTADMIKKHLAPPNESQITVLCGPPSMVKAMVSTLKKMNYPNERILSF